MDIYAERIKPLFDQSGKSDAELEREIGIPARKISQWNINYTKSYTKYIPQIAAYFHVSTDYLLGNTDTPKSPVEAEGAKKAHDPKIEGLSAARQKLYDAIANLTDEQCTKLLGVVEWAKENK